MEQVRSMIEPYMGIASRSLINYELPGGWSFNFSYFQAGLTALMLFLLVLTLGQLRHRFMHWQMSGVMPGVGFGFLLALILEGILIIGGRTILTELFGWKNAPKPISNALDAGRSQMVKVLGVAEEVPSSHAKEKTPTVGGVMSLYQLMDEDGKESLQSIVCEN